MPDQSELAFAVTSIVFEIELNDASFAMPIWSKDFAKLDPRQMKILKTTIKGSGYFAIDVVGESNYQENIRKIALPSKVSINSNRGPLVASLETQARIVSEPNNAHDPNAIQVQIEGMIVGYLDRETASRLVAQVSRKGFNQIDSTCTALIRGVYLNEIEEFNFGIKLDIDSTAQRRSSELPSEFSFQVANPRDVEDSLASVGMSVNFWQHPTIPGQINIYGGGTMGEGLLGTVPPEFVPPISKHLRAQLQFHNRIESRTGNIWNIRCRLIPESETKAAIEREKMARKARLELTLSKPYRPKKPFRFNFQARKDCLRKGDVIEVQALPTNEVIIEEHGRLPVTFKNNRTAEVFEVVIDHGFVEYLVRLTAEPVHATVVKRERTRIETTWFTAEVAPPSPNS